MGDIQQQIADGARPLARVDDVIEHGQDIPANVVLLRDQDNDLWRRARKEQFACLTDNTTTALIDGTGWWPVKVVEVDPEPQPASAAILVVGDDIEWGQGIPDHVIRMVGGALNGRPDSDPIDLCLMTETGNGGVTWWSAGGDEGWSNEDIPQECYPLRITRVREPDENRTARLAAEAEVQRLLARAPEAESGPITLSLPQVPDGAVALVGGARWLPSPDLPTAWCMEGGSVPYFLGRLLDAEYGSVTVEFAPPREPRVWPQLESSISDLPDVVEVHLTGIWRRRAGSTLFEQGPTWRTLAQLRELGEVREVLT